MIRSTKTTIEEFAQSMLWQDMLEELDGWINSITAEDDITGRVIDDNLSDSAAMALFGYRKGCKEAVDRFKIILEILYNNKEEENDSGRNEAE